MRPVFPVYLYASYDYGARNIDEYFHFYSIAGQKFKREKIFSKNLNNCMPRLFFHASQIEKQLLLFGSYKVNV